MSAQITTSVVKYLRDSTLKSKDEFNDWCVKFLGVHLASVPLDDGNSCPLDFAYDVYSTAIRNNLKATDVTNFLAMANRGGQKTLTCACVITALLMHDKFRDIIYMASISGQANVLFEVWLNRFVAMQYMGDIFPKLTMKRTVSHIGRMLTVTHGTMDAVNAHHGGILLQDEVDLTDPAVFDESKGMLVASSGRVPLNIMISSRKFAMGNIQQILDKIEDEPEFAKRIHVHKWGQLETTARCMDDRSGEFGTNIMVHDDKLMALSVPEWEILSTESKMGFREVTGFKNCLPCGIFSFCQGKLKRQIDNPHLTPIDVAVDYFRREGPEFTAAQRLNRKPSTKGIVYGIYDSAKHDKTLKDMVGLISPESPNVLPNLDELVKLIKSLRMPLYIGVDFGYNNAVALLITIDKLSRVYVLDEIALSERTDRDLALVTHNRWGGYGINYIFPDIAQPGGIKEFQKVWDASCGVCTDTNKDRDYGINLVRTKLLKPGTNEPMLFLNKDACKNLRFGFRNYTYKIDVQIGEAMDVIKKKFDHALDALRYTIATLLGKTPFTVSFGESSIPSTQYSIAGLPTMIKAPTGEELLRYSGRTPSPLPETEDERKKRESEMANMGGMWFSFE